MGVGVEINTGVTPAAAFHPAIDLFRYTAVTKTKALSSAAAPLFFPEQPSQSAVFASCLRVVWRAGTITAECNPCRKAIGGGLN